MQVNIFVKKHTVPFKMIKIGGCFLHEEDPHMKINTNQGNQGKSVNLNTGGIYWYDEEDQVVPMNGKCELWEEEDHFNE